MFSPDSNAMPHDGALAPFAAPTGAGGTEVWRAVARTLRCLNAIGDGRLWFVLLFTFSITGLLLAMSQSALAREQVAWGAVQGGLAAFAAFYGSNAAGWLTMQRARGLAMPSVEEALRVALTRAHRLLLVLPLVLLVLAVVAGALAGLLWVSRLPGVGPAVYALVVPAGVLTCGLMVLATLAVLVPLAAPAVWSGRRSWQALRWLGQVVRQRLPLAVALAAVLSLVVGLVGAVTSFVVMAGGQTFALVSNYLGIEVPSAVLLLSLLGHGVRGVAVTGLPPGLVPHVNAALVGGGVVFAVALVLPALVYLRGVAEIFLALDDSMSVPQANGTAGSP